MDRIPKISVLGLGNWGTALAHYLATQGNDVIGWSHRSDIVEEINRDHRNTLYAKNVSLSSQLRATTQINECLASPFILIVLPASALSDIKPYLGKINDTQTIISAVKGVPGDCFQFPTDLVAKATSASFSPVVLAGPCFAKDLLHGLPAGLIAASNDDSRALSVAKLFASKQIRVYTSPDPIGAQVGGTVKNVIAIAAGISDGLSLGESARAGLVTRGLAEILRFALACGAHQETIFGLSGLGDLSMTCASNISRNHIVGFRLAKGEALSQILTSLGSVAEGVRTAPVLIQAAREREIELPISEAVLHVLEGKLPPAEAVQRLIERPARAEF